MLRPTAGSFRPMWRLRTARREVQPGPFMKRFLVQGASLVASRLVTRLAQAAAIVVLARVLSPAGFGLYGALTSAVTLAVTLGNLGLRQAAARQIGQGLMTPGQAAATMSLLWIPLTVASIAGLGLASMGQSVELDSESKLALSIALAAALYVTLVQGVNLGRQQVKMFGFTDAGPRVLQAVAIGGLALVGSLTLASALWTFAVGFVVVAPIAVVAATRGGGRLQLAFAQTPTMIRYGLLFAISMFIITLQSRLGVFVLERGGDASAAGQFFAAQRMNEILLEIATAFGLVLFSQTVRANTFRESLELAMRPALGLFVLFVLLAGATVLAAPWATELVLGAAYSDAGPLVQILALGLPPAAFIKIMNGVVAGSGKPLLSAAIVGVGLAVNVALAIAWAPAAGAIGVAWAMVISLYAAMAAYAAVAMFGYGVTPGSILVRLRRPRSDGARS